MTDVDRVELPRPTWQMSWPFAAVALIGAASFAAAPTASATVEPWVALLLLAGVLVLLMLGLRRPQRSWLDAAPAYLFFVVFALGRDASGGSTSGLAPLVVLPILWLALTGTRRDLVVGAVLTAAAFMVPLVLVGAPTYPDADWRRALLWTAIAALVAPVVHRLVRQLATETERVAEASAERDDIMRGASLTSMISTDVDGTIRSFSAGSEELLGWSAADLVGRATPATFHDEGEVLAVAAELGVEPGFDVFVALAGGPSRVWTYVRSDGGHRYVRLAVTELHGASGRSRATSGSGSTPPRPSRPSVPSPSPRPSGGSWWSTCPTPRCSWSTRSSASGSSPGAGPCDRACATRRDAPSSRCPTRTTCASSVPSSTGRSSACPGRPRSPPPPPEPTTRSSSPRSRGRAAAGRR